MILAIEDGLWAWLGNQYGNIASVLGLLVSVVVLLLAENVRRQVKRAKVEVLRRVRRLILQRDFVEAIRLIASGVEATRLTNWPMAHDRLHAALLLGSRMRDHPDCSPDERAQIQSRFDGLSAILTLLNKIADGKRKLFPAEAAEELQQLLFFFSGVEARLLLSILENENGRDEVPQITSRSRTSDESR